MGQPAVDRSGSAAARRREVWYNGAGDSLRISRHPVEFHMIDDRNRRSGDPRKAAEAAFKAATKKPLEAPPAAPRAVPGVKEMVSLRLDKDVLEKFQENGPGWQDRINAALRKAAALD
jgi:uncharacterized protein (DUF4415 family)